jgi:hypothetical protein
MGCKPTLVINQPGLFILTEAMSTSEGSADHQPRLAGLRSPVWVIAWFLGVLFLAGCSRLRASEVPTLVPTEYLPTMIALTIEARLTEDLSPSAQGAQATLKPTNSLPRTATPVPEKVSPTAELVALASTLTPTQIPDSASATPAPGRATRTPTFTPTLSIPEAQIQIRQPGPLSKVTSPINVYGNLKPGSTGRVRLELLGEGGRLLVRKLMNYRTDIGHLGLSEEVDYEISAVAEAGRLQISTYDQYGRMEELTSVDLILLSMGEADLNPPGPLTEPIIIQEPLPNKLIQGGKVLISGLARVSSDQPLLIELIAANGSVVGYRQAGVTVDPAGGYTPFMIEVPYQISEPTWVRLTVKEMSSGRIEGVIQLTSLEVLLSP